MPELGEVKQGWEMGYGGMNSWIWHACVDCGKERWVRLVWGKPRSPRCHSCANGKGENHIRWKGEEYQSNGYLFLYKPEHPRVNRRGYVKRAILVLEQKLGRPLLPNMDSHHINGIKDDDRPRNLMELSHSEHRKLQKKLLLIFP